MSPIRVPLAAPVAVAVLGASLIVAAPAAVAAPSAAHAAKKRSSAKAAKKKKATTPSVVTACVNRKTGATKVLLGSKAKRRCRKGWTKMTWNVTGPSGRNGANGANGAAGPVGPNGAPLAVRDATGKRLGGFGGFLSLGYPLIQVIGDDGGVYTYLDSSGQLFPLGTGSPVFLDAACAGPAYLNAGTSATMVAMFVGGSFRTVFRSSSATGELGPARAWKLTATTTVVPAVVPPVYELGMTGACEAIAPAGRPDPGDYLMQLAPVAAPPDGVGPLTVG